MSGVPYGEPYGASDAEIADAVSGGHRAYWWMMTVAVPPRGAGLTTAAAHLRTAQGVVAVEPGETPGDVYARVLDIMAQRLRQEPGLDLDRGIVVLAWDLRPNDPLV